MLINIATIGVASEFMTREYVATAKDLTVLSWMADRDLWYADVQIVTVSV